MRFYLGTHLPHWLAFSPFPLFVSHNRLFKRMTFPRAKTGWALDSGGFTQITKYGRWLHGPDLYAQYVRLYMSEIGNLDWASPQDWMCEPVATAATGRTVRYHQIRTVENYLYLRDHYPDCPWVPVLQGWTLDDYAFCLKLYHHHDVDLASLPIVAVGSVCRRQSTHQIGDIFRFLSGEGLACHGFGVKLEGVRKYGQFLASSDSMAWSAGARRNPRMEACTHPGSCANCWRRAIAWRREVMQAIGSLDGACSPG